MKPLLYVSLIMQLLICPAYCLGAERIAREWDFSKGADTLGWSVAEPATTLTVENGALKAVAAGTAKVQSPFFDIAATPWQYIEVELRTSAGGHGLIYYSNTTEEPYGGFRPEQFAPFALNPDGEFHTYTIPPFWQKQGKITHIRLDTPGSAAIKAIRLVDATPAQPSRSLSWKFKDTTDGWSVMASLGQMANTPMGCDVTGNNNFVALSPPIDLNSDDHLWVTLRMASKTEHTALLRWATSASDGLKSLPIQLHGDKMLHSYPIDLGRVSAWDGKIIALGITPSETTESRSVMVESISIGDGPVGPAELELARFGTDKPIPRVGQKAKLQIDVKNTGGEDAQSVVTMVTLVTKNADPAKSGKVMTLPTKRVAKLKPGETTRFEWDIDSKNGPELQAVCHVLGAGLDVAQKTIDVKFYPAPDASKPAAKYVPEPQPADTGGYLVGAYYFPGWQNLERWSVLDDFPERKPLLGYYREGDPEVVDWQISWALSHGISYFIYDWYWDRGNRSLQHGIDAFLKSRYQDKFKFCLLWANHNPPKSSSEADLLAVTKYWIENYFNKPNYVRVSGKNVVVIFQHQRLTDDMGRDAVKAALPKMRKLCEDAGVGGLYLVACANPGEQAIKDLMYEGYDALSGYNYPLAGNKGQRTSPYAWQVDAYKEFWNQIADAATTPYIPVCEPGWDSRPWHGRESYIRTGKSPYLWQTMLENAKTFVDDPKRKQAGDKKLVFLEAWNEYGEGDYIEPHAEYGFRYLDAVREVFAPASKDPGIVLPEDLGMGPYEPVSVEPKTSWDFSKPEDQTWTGEHVSNASYTNAGFHGEADGNDPLFYSPRLRLDVSKFKTIEIKMRMDKGQQGQVFFSRPDRSASEERSVRFKVTPDNEFHVYEIDMSANPLWRGSIGQIRLDPTAEAGAKVEIAYVGLK